jgi:hypothetical protein
MLIPPYKANDWSKGHTNKSGPTPGLHQSDSKQALQKSYSRLNATLLFLAVCGGAWYFEYFRLQRRLVWITADKFTCTHFRSCFNGYTNAD